MIAMAGAPATCETTAWGETGAMAETAGIMEEEEVVVVEEMAVAEIGDDLVTGANQSRNGSPLVPSTLEILSVRNLLLAGLRNRIDLKSLDY